jgi:hypothetical protein
MQLLKWRTIGDKQSIPAKMTVKKRLCRNISALIIRALE